MNHAPSRFSTPSRPSRFKPDDSGNAYGGASSSGRMQQHSGARPYPYLVHNETHETTPATAPYHDDREPQHQGWGRDVQRDQEREASNFGDMYWTPPAAPPPPILRLNLKYASCTLAGRNAGFPKDNQDSWAVKEHLGSSQHVLFGVFDGHGAEGKVVSNIVATALPKLIAAALGTMMKYEAYEELMVSTFQECNRLLGRIDNLDCSMSGSTGVVAVLAASRLIVSNLGDSRCILGRVEAGANGTRPTALEMTNDHTPALLAESSRVLAAGGRIASYACGHQPIGALRVWLPDKDIPGLSMTRCFGDTLAASVGVIDVPEVLVYDIQPEDRYLVLMSDGVSQHISTHEIMELVHWCATVKKMQPSKVAKQLVKEARKRWAALEDSADDCTAIVVFLQPVLGQAPDPTGPSTPAAARWSLKRLFKR